jgi:hypothetical protein
MVHPSFWRGEVKAALQIGEWDARCECAMRMRDANARCECAMRMRDANARTIIPFDHQQSPKGRCRALTHLVIVAKVEIVIHNVNGSVHPPLVIKFVGQFVNNQDVPHVVKNWGAVN